MTLGARVPSSQAFITPKYDDQPSDPISAGKGLRCNHNDSYPVILRSEVDFKVSCTNRLVCLKSSSQCRDQEIKRANVHTEAVCRLPLLPPSAIIPNQTKTSKISHTSTYIHVLLFLPLSFPPASCIARMR
jgi:hypothetical protein